MRTFSYYNTATGALLGTTFSTDRPDPLPYLPATGGGMGGDGNPIASTPSSTLDPTGPVLANMPAGASFIEGVFDPNTQYVNVGTGSIANRVATSITLAQAAAVVTLAGVKLGTVVTVGGDTRATIIQDAVDGGLVLTFANPGNYTLSAAQFPEQAFSASITV